MELHPLGTVLVVEDDRPTRDMVASLVHAAGFRPVTAEDGLEALHLLRAVRRREPHAACVVLLDLSMPRLGGREFRRAQLRDPLAAVVPVIVMTGATDAEAQAAGIGAVATLAKPLDPMRLVDTVRRHCVSFSDASASQTLEAIARRNASATTPPRSADRSTTRP